MEWWWTRAATELEFDREQIEENVFQRSNEGRVKGEETVAKRRRQKKGRDAKNVRRSFHQDLFFEECLFVSKEEKCWTLVWDFVYISFRVRVQRG